MRKFLAFVMVVALLAVSVPVFAAIKVANNGTDKGVVEQINFTTGTTATRAGQIATVAVTGCSATPTVTGGTINGAVVGGSSPAAGTFTSLVASAPNFTDGTVNTADINWSSLTDAQLKANTSINWADVTGL